MQVSITAEDGKRLQPDAIINLPDKKHIIIDAKVSLVAYEAFVSAATEEERERNLAAHVISVKNHIKGLSEKNYQGLGQLNTPDFVLLFMPIESSFSLAVQADNELFNYAWERKIVIVSPSTLLATLRTISSIWKQERQTRNALEIAKQSGDLYDKFAGFVDDLLAIGKKMNDAKSSYDDAMKKLSSGKGNLVRRAEIIKELGAKTTKDISQPLLDRAKDNE
jgi:DNA recombination protein RmuC